MPGNRTVVEAHDRTADRPVRARNIFMQASLPSKKEWPNRSQLLIRKQAQNLDIQDNGIEVGQIMIRFSDATTANVKGITQFILPSDEKEMILIHNTHRTPQSLVVKRLAPYTKECLQSSAQLMSSEKHYGGRGGAQMAQDFMDQFERRRIPLEEPRKNIVFDSLEKEKKRECTRLKSSSTRRPLCQGASFPSIKEYGITVADAAITDVDYEDKVDQKLIKIIDAVTKSSISKQELMTAQQQTLTGQGPRVSRRSWEIEYQQKQEQTRQVVEG